MSSIFVCIAASLESSKALKLVLSVLDDAAYETDSGIYTNLRDRLAPDAFLEIEPLLPAA